MSSSSARYFPGAFRPHGAGSIDKCPEEASSTKSPLDNSEGLSRLEQQKPEDETSSGTSDEILLSRIASGDVDAFAVLFRHFGRSVRAVALRILGDAAEAEDIIQESFLYIHRNSRSFDPLKGSARSWVLQIAYHRALDRLRHLQNRRFYKTEAIDESATSIADPKPMHAFYESSLEGALGRQVARQLFESLSLDQREVIRLALYEGYTFEEIAQLRGQSFGNVRNHYYRGLEKLRRQVFAAKLQGR